MGIQIFPVVHGEAQLRERWGDNGAQVIMDTCGAKMFFPGITDPATLDLAAKVCGQVSTTRIYTDPTDPLTREAVGRIGSALWPDAAQPQRGMQLGQVANTGEAEETPGQDG